MLRWNKEQFHPVPKLDSIQRSNSHVEKHSEQNRHRNVSQQRSHKNGKAWETKERIRYTQPAFRPEASSRGSQRGGVPSPGGTEFPSSWQNFAVIQSIMQQDVRFDIVFLGNETKLMSLTQQEIKEHRGDSLFNDVFQRWSFTGCVGFAVDAERVEMCDWTHGGPTHHGQTKDP